MLMMSSPSEPSGPLRAVSFGAPGVLDAGALARLSELDPGGKGGLVERVLGTYVQSLQRLLGQLQVARRDRDAQAQRHVAHTLKSSSASVGALALAALCAGVEHQLRDGPIEGLDTQLDSLAAEGQRVLAALSQP
jgi:HPt (histidine-containing phosphotransfer) domain-containing protein